MKNTAIITGARRINLCINCNSPKSYKGKYCKPCSYKHRFRPRGLKYNITSKNKGWFTDKTRKQINMHGYVSIYLGKGKRITEHRLILENHLERRLNPNEVIHHINGDKLDNGIDNLQLMTKKEHDNLHMGRSIKIA